VRLVATLRRHYGSPPPPPVTDPWEQVLFENVAYLTSDAKRLAAWKRFRASVGTRPERILAAPVSAILPIVGAGILPADRVEKIKEAAAIARDLGGDLTRSLDSASPDAARRMLRRFPGIGYPGAEKILLVSRREKVLALDSNGLRVLLRLGFGREGRGYAATHRSVQDAARLEERPDFRWLIAAHQLLRLHGQELCKRSRPLCDRCPLTRHCLYFSSRTLKA